MAIAGVIAVTGYAGLTALQALVLDPLAAVPGETLARVHALLEGQEFDVTGDIRSVLGSAIIGVTLAALVAIPLVFADAWTQRNRRRARTVLI